ncbi:S9 family peptidase [Alicyclobacillus fastidiosus]|uniref:S9 family peptidase n=1 Tax=Alicyclobacillus fastidiosus TaxID=392011 RepID=A0ABY6ZLS6_9BACL|nr:alpha/beta fold hydrolase [Alicyclobacillus fastidiosus]WAH43432.1 S9 family peptidase [Alicyclobacillus fastidiosus]GMA59584.1 alpha/beta hydrolase [Alicyclobacillus fastidiosus]GMA65510.1 alpha/beta hydrolase [Alicyclobacillus fastidiosus]
MYKRLGTFVLSTVIVLFLGTMTVSYIVGFKLTHPTPKPVTETPGAIRLPYQNIHFPSRIDKLSLSGWLIPAASRTNRVVIEAHGYRENRILDHPSLPTAKALHDAGFSVILFDFRDEGDSPGKEVSVGEYEVRDLLGAVDYAKSLGYSNIGIIGYSMGASTALEATAEDTDVKATVADSPFADLQTYLDSNMTVWTHLPAFPFNDEIFWEMKHFFQLDPAKADPLKDLASAKPRPILLIAGEADTTIPMQNSEELYRELQRDPDDSLWLVPGAKHVGAYDVEPATYEQRVTQFFTKYLGHRN